MARVRSQVPECKALFMLAHPGGLELLTFWFVVKFRFAISLICLGSAYLLNHHFVMVCGSYWTQVLG